MHNLHGTVDKQCGEAARADRAGITTEFSIIHTVYVHSTDLYQQPVMLNVEL